MKLLYLIVLVFLISCNNKSGNTNQKSENPQKIAHQNLCIKKNSIVTDTVFVDSEILASIYYDNNCKIKKVDLITQIDGRSGNMQSDRYIKHVSLEIGHFNEMQSDRRRFAMDSGWIYRKKDNLLFLTVTFPDPFLDTLNYIDLSTVFILEKDGVKKTKLSHFYFYNRSKYFLEIEDTYLDYVAFKSSAVVKKVLSKKDGFIEKVRIAVKVNQNIDDIDYIEINLNKDIKLNFVCSIVAGKDIDFDFIDHDCKLESMLKMEAEYLQLDVNILNLKLQSINHLSVKLNDTKY